VAAVTGLDVSGDRVTDLDEFLRTRLDAAPIARGIAYHADRRRVRR
jgi:hypothetical protein